MDGEAPEELVQAGKEAPASELQARCLQGEGEPVEHAGAEEGEQEVPEEQEVSARDEKGREELEEPRVHAKEGEAVRAAHASGHHRGQAEREGASEVRERDEKAPTEQVVPAGRAEQGVRVPALKALVEAEVPRWAASAEHAQEW